MSSLFVPVTKLIRAIWPIALNSTDFIDPMIMDHTLNWLW